MPEIYLLACGALVLSIINLAGTVYALLHSHKMVTTNHVALSRATDAAVAQGANLIVNCTTCKSAVARFSLAPEGPVCANCKPLK